MEERAAKGCGLWKPRGARVGICLSLERSFGSLLLAQSQPSRLRCERPTAVALRSQPLEGAVIEVGGSRSHRTAAVVVVTALVHPQSA
jgi:hypothetical protein